MRWASLALAAALLVGCARPSPPVSLAGTWPSQPGGYTEVTRAWTRQAELQRDYQLVAEVHATFKAPAWRAAWIERRARLGKLSEQARAELLVAEQAADAAAYEVVIIMSTWDRRENDLHRGDRSIWRVVLVDGDGNEIPPIEIVRDRRSDHAIHDEFPHAGDFSEAYIARFPRTAAVLGPGVSRIGLRVSSTRGGLELTWADTK